MNKVYVTNPKVNILYKNRFVLSSADIVEAMNYANRALKELSDTTMKFDINIFETLGMRNLSGMIGEYFARSVAKISDGKLVSNLHQDGSPDLLLVDTPVKKRYLESLYTVKEGKKYPVDKEHFSPFKYGGIEVKATCGSTPSASKAKNIIKPLIGEQRVNHIVSFDWKAHHRETNHLLGVLWDFIDGLPVYVAAFYCDRLCVDDWGKVVQPKEDGGRTTSVSIMNSKGIRKMCDHWVAVIDSPQYIELLSRQKWIGYEVK